MGRGGTHDQVLRAAALASAHALLRGLDQPTTRPIWQAWARGHMTKIVKHTSTSRVTTAAADYDGRLFHDAEATAAAFTPSDRDQWPSPLRRAQVQGLSRERCAQRWEPTAGLWVLLDSSLGMSTGKSAAQAAHALSRLVWGARIGALDPALVRELETVGFADVDQDTFAQFSQPEDASWVTAVRDNGHTEVAAGSMTAVLVQL